MAWLSTAPADWTIDGVDYVRVSVPFAIDGEAVLYRFEKTSTRKHKGCMTKAAADNEAATYKAANPTHEVTVARQNDAGAYRVDVVARDVCTWEPEE